MSAISQDGRVLYTSVLVRDTLKIPKFVSPRGIRIDRFIVRSQRKTYKEENEYLKVYGRRVVVHGRVLYCWDGSSVELGLTKTSERYRGEVVVRTDIESVRYLSRGEVITMDTLHLARPVNTMMQDCEYFCTLRKDYVDNYVAMRQKKNESAGVRKRYTHADLAAELKITRSYFSALYNGRPASGEFIPRALAHFENGNAQYFPVVFDCKKIDRDVNDIKYSWDWKEQRRENAPRIGDTNG